MNDNLEIDKPKKNNALGISVLMLVIGILIGGAGYFFYTNYVNKPDVSLEEKEEDEESVEKYELLNISDKVVIDTYKKLRAPVVNCDEPWEFFSGTGISANEVQESTAKKLATEVIRKEKLGENKTFMKGEAFTKQELRDAVTSLFGEDYKYSDGKIEGLCPAFEYDTTTEKYSILAEPACGCTSGPGNMDLVVGAQRKGDILEINAGALFMNPTNGSYYKDYAKTKLITGLETMYGDSTMPAINSVENIGKGSVYRFTFKKGKDNTYAFVESELIG